MVDERRAYQIVVFESGTRLAHRVQDLLQNNGGPPRLAVASATTVQDPGFRKCDLLIIDIDGPTDGPLEFLRQCRRLYPRLPAVAIVHQGDTSAAVAVTKAGAVDCLEKPVNALQLQSAIRTVVSNSRMLRQYTDNVLTKTEVQVLELILAGKRTHAIAHELHRSKRTIDVHRRNLMRKLGATGLASLVRRAFSIGFVPPDVSVDIPAPSATTCPSIGHRAYGEFDERENG